MNLEHVPNLAFRNLEEMGMPGKEDEGMDRHAQEILNLADDPENDVGKLGPGLEGKPAVLGWRGDRRRKADCSRSSLGDPQGAQEGPITVERDPPRYFHVVMFNRPTTDHSR